MTLPVTYTALIRSYKSAPLIFDVIDALRNQSCPPVSIMAVDSGTTGDELQKLKDAVDDFVDISSVEFNYSRAINLGVAACKTPHVLIISSHVLFRVANVMQLFFDQLSANGTNMGFMISDASTPWQVREVNRVTFNGENGLTNSCSFLPVSAITELPFREEVFASEDQDWTARFLSVNDGKLIAVNTHLVQYLNPRFSYAKKLNEELALAYFVDRRRMSAQKIGLWLIKALWSCGRFDFKKAQFRLLVAWGLLMAHVKRPAKVSRYFK